MTDSDQSPGPKSGTDGASAPDINLAGNQADGLSASAPATPAADDATDIWAAALAEQAAATAPAASPVSPPAAQPAPTPVQPVNFPALDDSGNVGAGDLSFIKDIPVQLTVELGRTRMTIKNLLQLGQGSVVELDGLAGEPMDIFVNGFLIAQGEVVVVEDRYGIRLTDIITPADRLNRLNGKR
ncbi:MAG: flagellar motor switch protein FliN [Comamonas sp.]